MKPFTRLGGETLTVGARVPIVDGDGVPVRGEYNQVQYQRVRVTVPFCSFRQIGSTEHDLNTHATDVVARGRMPLTCPGPDGPVSTPVPVGEDEVTWQRDGQTYILQGPARREVDAAGDPDHIVFLARLRSA